MKIETYFPFLKEKVVAQVGQATLGVSSHTSESVKISPFHKSNPHRGQSPCIP